MIATRTDRKPQDVVLQNDILETRVEYHAELQNRREKETWTLRLPDSEEFSQIMLTRVCKVLEDDSSKTKTKIFFTIYHGKNFRGLFEELEGLEPEEIVALKLINALQLQPFNIYKQSSCRFLEAFLSGVFTRWKQNNPNYKGTHVD